jgi:putative chitinase
MGNQPLKLLQEKAGTTPDGVFGPNTLRAAVDYYQLTPEQGAHFFGQTSHESAQFTVFSENLNYSADALLRVFGKYFHNLMEAEEYARQPEKIANRVYANRMGNDNEASRDGWRYRGRGAIQLTGKWNYRQFASDLKDQDILLNPDLVEEQYAFDCARWYFDQRDIWNYCDQVSDERIGVITRMINGGTNGLEDRRAETYLYYEWLS